jgi:protease-4
MGKACFSLILFICFLQGAFSESPFLYYSDYTDFLTATPGTSDPGLGGFSMPAVLSFHKGIEVLSFSSINYSEEKIFEKFAFITAFPYFSFGFILLNPNTSYSQNHYRLNGAIGTDYISFGLSYGWHNKSSRMFDRDNYITLNLILKLPFLSIGSSFTTLFSGENLEAVFDLGIRPLRNNKLTIFGDFAIAKNHKIGDADYSFGITSEFLDGIEIGTKIYPKDLSLSFSLNISFGNFSIINNHNIKEIIEDSTHYTTTFGIRIGPKEPSIITESIKKDKYYLKLNLKGEISYQTTRFFPQGYSLYELLTLLDRAQKENCIAGVVINISGMQAPREFLWELREKLKKIQAEGKKVIIYIDNANTDTYFFASVADKIVMDPFGMLHIKGYLSGRTFFKGTLEKYGIGFEELNFFKYKSAAENLSREDFSEEDREQRLALIEDLYYFIADEICSSREISYDEFNHLVNDICLFTAGKALENNLVDGIGRWDKIEEIIGELEGKTKFFISENQLENLPQEEDELWGIKPKIALVYAVGTCSMDTGIKVRKLETILKNLIQNPVYKAIVIRIDSPGGAPLASDILAQIIKDSPKPIVISQGSLAASGGYWVSMFGDKIVTSPTTITGSIGVIAGWIYNNGFKENFGITTDFVKIGDHADFGFGFSLPFIGTILPDRNLNEDEINIAKEQIFYIYDQFVQFVQEGRNLTEEEVEEIASGRIWSGRMAVENGLADMIGGLEEAIETAKELAGIPDERPVEVVEYPRMSLFNWSFLLELITLSESPEITNLSEFQIDYANLQNTSYYNDFDVFFTFLLNQNGKPLTIMSIDDFSYFYDYIRPLN